MANTDGSLLGYALYVLFRRKVMIIVTFLVVFVSMIFFIWLITPTFMATSRVLVHNNYKQQLALFSDLVSPGVFNPRVNWAVNILELAKSNELSEQLVREFRLDERFRQKIEDPQSARESIKATIVRFAQLPARKLDEWGVVKQKPKDYFAEALENFQRNTLVVELVEETEIVELAIYGESPQLANDMVGRLTELLIQHASGLDRTVAQRVYKQAATHLADAERAYGEARTRLEAYKQRWQVTSFDDEKRLTLDSLQSMEKELAQVKASLAGKRAEIKEIKARLGEPQLRPAEYYDLDQALTQLQRSEADLEGRGGQLGKTIAAQKEEIAHLIERENEYLRLEQQADLAEDLFLALKKKTNELLVQANAEIGEFSIRVVDRFRVSPYANPDRPKMLLLVPFALFFAFGSALVLAFLGEYGLAYPRSADELRGLTSHELLVVVPRHGLLRRVRR